MAAKVQKYGATYKTELAQDGINIDRLLHKLATATSPAQSAAIDPQGLHAVKQIESFLKAEDANEKPSAIAKTFTAHV